MRLQDHKAQTEGTKRQFTLMVGTWSSECGYCGQDVLPDEKTHHTVAGYGGGEAGCGVEFKYICGLYKHIHNDPEYSLPKHMNREDLIELSMDQLSEEEI